MSTIEIKSKADSISLYYEDWGKGSPVILIHGWPLSHEMWEHQLSALPNADLRCIAYDRRGFGKSSKTWSGYDYDTLAHDLKGLIDGLDLTNVTLVGFSMGGGEVARYLSLFGEERISKAVFIGSVTPLLMKDIGNPEGVSPEQFDSLVDQIQKDRPAFLTGFGKQFYGQGLLSNNVSNEVLMWSSQLAMRASPKATTDCVRSFSKTDFRADLKKITVPTLVIHGDADQTVPFDTTGKITAQSVKNAELLVYEGAPHGLFMTHSERLNEDLINFIRPE